MGNQNSRLLLEAASSGSVSQLKSVLGKADVNATDQDGWSALHFSAWAGRLEVLEELLKHGPVVNLRDKVGRTPLHLAALRGQAEAVDALCDHGALVNAVDDDGIAPIHKAVIHSNTEVAEELIARGADASLPLPDGTTPLHLAAFKGNPAMLSLLLANGGDANAENCDGQTPLFEAANAGHADALQVLLDANADTGHKDKEGKTAGSDAPADIAALLRPGQNQGWVGLPRPLSAWPATKQPANASGQGQSAEAAPGFWARLARLGSPQVAPAATGVAPQNAPAIVRPSDAQPRVPERAAAATATPSAPPLPGVFHGGLYSTDGSSSAQDLQPLMPYPSLPLAHSARTASAEGASAAPPVPPPTEWLSIEPASGTTSALAVRESGSGPTDISRQTGAVGEGEEAPGMVAWAVQTAGAASGAAFSALLGALPWPGKGAESAQAEPEDASQSLPADEQQRQSGRYGLPDDEVEEDTEVHAGALDQDMELDPPEVPTTAYTLFRPEVLWEATGGLSPEARLDHGACSSAHRAQLPAGLAGPGERAVAVRAYDWGAWRALSLQPTHLNALAEMQHPNLLPLLGVCPESRQFVYGLMQNGSVDDALHGRRPPGAAGPVRLDWAARTRLGCEAAAALQHLHTAHSMPIVHGRLQPSTILLDEHLRGRLGDAGVAATFGAHQVRQATPYLAPEVAAGCRPTPASDLYSLGVVLLQLLTGSEPAGLVRHMADAARNGAIDCTMDPCAGGWPLEDAIELCQLALRCTAEGAGSRPRLASELLPALCRLSGRAESAVRLSTSTSASSQEPPAMLICPITQDLMEDPVVAADGVTYSRAAIEEWLRSGHDTSPMTNLRLAHRHLTPNYTLRSVALEWRAARNKGLS